MQEVQLYIEDVRVDLFKDETISLTSTVKDVRDFSKVFTDFSKSFTLPASKTNNKLFKHYYNSDIEGFDARVNKDAHINLNYLPFREGKIKLNGVKMKDNKAYAYSVTFFGNTVNLKNIIGSDELDSLPLDQYNHTFESANVLTGLTNQLFDGDIIYPLITHEKRYYYDSTFSNHATENIAYHPLDLTVHGIDYPDLKPAIRLSTLIDAIESKYTVANGYPQSIVFSDDFLDASNEAFANLYMWLNRNKGRVGLLPNGEVNIVTTPTSFIFLLGSGTDFVTFVNTNSEWQMTMTPTISVSGDLTITPTQTTKKYDIEIVDTVSGDTLFNEQNLIGTQTKTINLEEIDREYQIKVIISSTDGLLEYDAKWRIEKIDGGTIEGSYEILDVPHVDTVNVPKNIPKMKVLDFITSLFKMFNLTAYISGTELKVLPLDTYYNTFNVYDITEYVDVKSSGVDNALPFREVNFKYKEPKTFLADAFKDINNIDFGTLEYNGEEKLDGGKYDITIPYEHMVYERLIDANDDINTNVQYGYFVDKKQEPLVASPLIFYNILQSVGSKKVSYIGSGSNVAIGSGGFYTSINRPSNTNEDAPADYTINFGAEFDEWNASLGLNNNSLFEKFYKTYITDTFNLKNRLTKITAYLPLRILLNYTLADRFIVNGKQYKINSINTNLQNGKSQIELLNDFS